MPIKICTEVGFRGEKKKFAGAIDNLAKRQFYGPVRSAVVSIFHFNNFSQSLPVTFSNCHYNKIVDRGPSAMGIVC